MEAANQEAARSTSVERRHQELADKIRLDPFLRGTGTLPVSSDLGSALLQTSSLPDIERRSDVNVLVQSGDVRGK